MNDRTKDAGIVAETAEAQARRLGLERLYQRFPAIYEIAAKRALIKRESVPSEVSPATEPSLIFAVLRKQADE